MKLNLKELISKLVNAPIVIEEGTSGIWTYRKWSSGIAECWGTKSKSISGVSKTAPFSGYCYEIGAVAFPTGLFISTPTATVSGRLDSNYMCVSYSPVSTSSVSVELQANVSGTRTAYAYIHALGLWK